MNFNRLDNDFYGDTREQQRQRNKERQRWEGKVLCGTSIAISAARSSVKMSDINRYLAFDDLVFSCFQGSRFRAL